MARKLLVFLLFLSIFQGVQAQVPVAGFSANTTSGCAPLTVIFKDESTGNPVFWNWDFGEGRLSNLQNPVMTFSTPGTYSVTLVVRNADGTNGITKTNYITVNPSPIAAFTADKTIGCIPSTIQFTDQSDPVAGSIVKWEWDFGDGTTSTQRSPAHQYNATGFYTVTLKVTSSTGCMAVRSIGRYIRIVAGVIPDFSVGAPPTCRPPFNVNFSNLSSGPGAMTYQWNLGNGNTSTDESPATTYAAAGTYTVTLTATSEYGCVANVQKPVDITGMGTGFTGPDTICINNTATFQNTSSTAALATTWDFGNGETAATVNGSSAYFAAGIYPVKMINVYTNCTDSFERPLVVVDKPPVNFTAPVKAACQAPFTVNFQAAAPTAATWLWDFGDGATSTEQNPAHQYNTEGNFDVTLTITTRQGCTNTLTQSAFVKIQKPTVSFAGLPMGGCVSYTFHPTLNVNAVDPVKRYDWDWGDGQHSSTTVPNTSHVYNAVGRYTVSVTITTEGGCTATATVPEGVRVGVPPIASFTATPLAVCASDEIQFNAILAPAPPGVPVDEYLWEFGDDSTSILSDPKHLYAEAGTYTVSLTTFNDKCPSAPATQSVTVRPPSAKFTHTVDCTTGLQVRFTDESKLGTLTDVTYAWDFGDGSTATTAGNVTHTYAAKGSYNVSLTVSSATSGCSHTYSQKVTLVQEQPEVEILTKPTCKNELFKIAATGVDPANIAEYAWKIDAAPYVIGSSPQITTLSTAGTHSITLRIKDINGCESTSPSVNVTVTGPAANFSPALTGGCTNKDVTFNDLSTPAGSIAKWSFDFGDGTIKDFSSAPFTHAYADTGTYVIKLAVTDNNGCVDSITSTDAVRITQPIAGFKAAYPTICPKTDLPFTDTSSGKGLSWHWDFGDGTTSTEQSPVHRYTANSGSFGVKLVVTDENGCKDSSTRADYITVKKPVPAFTAVDTSSVCPLLETKFTFGGSDYETFYWDFGDGTTSTLTNPNHFYNNYGSYEAKLYLIGYGGCVDSASRMINVYDPNTSATLQYSPLTSCNALNVDFTLTTPPDISFVFSYGDGGLDSSQSKSFQHFFNQPGFYAPAIILKDGLGCQAVKGGPSTIRVIGALPLFGVDKKNFCDQGTVNFTNYTIGNDPVVTENWEFGDGSTSTDLNPTHLFTRPGTFVVKHNVITQTGCANTVTDTIRVYATPDPTIVSDTVTCIDQVITLKGQLAVPDTAITWKWDLGSNGQSAAQDVSIKYPAAGTYTVSLEAANKLGCKDNTSKSILVPPTPTVTVNGNTTIPVGTAVTMPVAYSDNIASYLWSPARDLSCTNCPTPVANPTFTTTYNVRVQDIYGCSATAGITITVVCNQENYFVPNTFSPNGDGQNDVFMPRGKSIARVNRMQVFNRWGELVYEKRNFMVNDASAGWNGTYKGKPAAADVYVYVIEFVCDNASVIPFRGNVTLLR